MDIKEQEIDEALQRIEQRWSGVIATDAMYLVGVVKALRAERDKYKNVLEVEFADEKNWEVVWTERSDGTDVKVPSWKWGTEPWKIAQSALKDE